MFVLTWLVTRPLLANSARAVNLLEESGPGFPSGLSNIIDVVIAPFERLYVQNLRHFVSIISEIRSIIWEFWHNHLA